MIKKDKLIPDCKNIKMKLICTVLLFYFPCRMMAQINLETGASQINIPLFSYSDKDNLNCNISLYYIDGNGLKVSEVASTLGTGWNLQSGGVITREQRGLPDDQKRSNIYQNPLRSNLNMTFDEYYNTYFPNGYLFSAYSPSDNISNEGGYIKMYPPYGGNPATNNGNIPIKESIAADREQDIFHLDYEKGSAEFVIGKNGQIKVLNDSRIKIEMFQSNMLNSNIKTCIDYFVVTATDGIQYIFSNKELSQTCTYNDARFPDDKGTISLDENPPRDWTFYYAGTNPPDRGIPVFIGKKTQNYIVTKWYLTRILNPRTNKAILFNYEQYDIDILGQRQFGCIVQTGQYDKRSVTINREVIKALRLNKIICPASQINFVYETTPRIDVPNGTPLTEIQIINTNNLLLKKYLFQYRYFFKSEIRSYTYPFTANESFYARLCLKSIQEVGNEGQTTLPPYSFDYYTGGDPANKYSDNIVPPTFSYFTDHWGFFNAHVLYDYPNQPNQIPNGGTISNICINASAVRAAVNGMAQNGIIKQITYPAGGSLTYEYEQNDAFYNGQNITVGGVRVKKTTLYDGINHDKDIIKEYKYLKDDQISSSGWGYEPQVYSNSIYTRIYKEAGGKVGVLAKDFAYATATICLSAGSTFLQKFNSTFFTAAPNASLLSTIIEIFVILFTPSEPAYKDQSELIYSNVSIQSNNPLPYQYSRVEIVNKILTGDNGKTVYEFTSDIDKSIDILNFYFPFSHKARYTQWAYGLPKRIAIYNNSNPTQIVKETINTYNFFTSFMSDANFMSKKWEANKLIYDAFPSDNQEYLNLYANTTESIYYPQTGHTELTSTKERIYNQDASGYQETLTTYTYNPINFQLNTITSTNSKGEIIKQQFYYPEDYSSTGIFSTLINNNIVNVPISSETWITKNGDQPRLLNATATDFGIIGNGDIKPIKTYSLESPSPVPQSVLQSFNPNSVVRDPNYLKEQQQYAYDNYGNLIQTKGKTSSAIYETSNVMYDYNGRFPTMNIKNANSGDYAYTSFEAENQGKWQYNNSNIQLHPCPTGKMCYQLIAGRDNGISTYLRITNTYILSFWATNNNFQISFSRGPINMDGTSPSLNPTKIINGVDGWTYYEYEISRRLGLLEITGSALVDELRLYPKSTQMVTHTYDSFGHVDSECDANNHILYYEYDGLGKLLLVRDQNKNILKKYCYNYAGQVENCGFDITPLWQNTETLTRCKITNGQNTGEQEQEQKDMNAHSVTYNQARWIVVGNNLTACPMIVPIYARLQFSDWYYDSERSYATISIKFYSDAFCTIPLFVNNLSVSYEKVNTLCRGGSTSYYYNRSCTGSEVSLGTQLMGWDDGANWHCYNNQFQIMPGTGYKVR